MFTKITTIAVAAALSLTALAIPAGQELSGEMAATYEDGPWSYLPESMAHGENVPAPVPMEDEWIEPEPSLIASLMARITG